jgi:hypothetical protein
MKNIKEIDSFVALASGRLCFTADNIQPFFSIGGLAVQLDIGDV